MAVFDAFWRSRRARREYDGGGVVRLRKVPVTTGIRFQKQGLKRNGVAFTAWFNADDETQFLTHFVAQLLEHGGIADNNAYEVAAPCDILGMFVQAIRIKSHRHAASGKYGELRVVPLPRTAGQNADPFASRQAEGAKSHRDGRHRTTIVAPSGRHPFRLG